MKTGIQLIAEERERQVNQEGWTAEHDSEHEEGELALAAACYALAEEDRRKEDGLPPFYWPWGEEWWKPTPDDRLRELVKAGALIVAEIDRLNTISHEEAIQK